MEQLEDDVDKNLMLGCWADNQRRILLLLLL